MPMVPAVSRHWLKMYYGVEAILSRSAELSQRNVLLPTITMLCASKSQKVIEASVNRPSLVHLAPRKGQRGYNTSESAVLGGTGGPLAALEHRSGGAASALSPVTQMLLRGSSQPPQNQRAKSLKAGEGHPSQILALGGS